MLKEGEGGKGHSLGLVSVRLEEDEGGCRKILVPFLRFPSLCFPRRIEKSSGERRLLRVGGAMDTGQDADAAGAADPDCRTVAVVGEIR